MMHILGIDSDNTFLHTLQRAQILAPKQFTAVNLRAVIERGTWNIEVGGSCQFVVDDHEIVIKPYDSIYARLVDIDENIMTEKNKLKASNIFAGLVSYLTMHKGLVLNRPLAGMHNGAKPLHEYMIRKNGLSVPDSLATADLSAVRSFIGQGESIVKALSGIRASCNDLIDSDISQDIAGPLYVQRKIYGSDVRVHVIINFCYAIKIDSGVVDYRDHLELSKYSRTTIPTEIALRLIKATKMFGLIFAGWDFKIDRNMNYWCLEANPMPGYVGYDIELGGEISAKLIETMRNT